MIPTEIKNNVLNELASLVEENATEIMAANTLDLKAYSGEDESMYDRLKVDDKKVKAMISAVEAGIGLEDPEGKILYQFHHDNGMRVENRTVPFGNILIIYESRPDVTIEAALTAFKAGNKIFLKGGKEARNSNLLLTSLWHKALHRYSIPKDYVTYLEMNRTETQDLIRKNTHNVDLIIPRGGEGLINFVRNNTDIPVIVSGRGNNFLYIDNHADFAMAIDLVVNGKSRISVCNALDKVLINSSLPSLDEKIDQLVGSLMSNGIEVMSTAEIADARDDVSLVENKNVWYEEFLAPKIMVSCVENMEQAIDKINTFSGGHSATIVTTDDPTAEIFMRQVDSAAVYHNASTRFTDGGQFGYGAEMAISTQKVHFRGPVGIGQLVTNKWFIYGSGQVR